LDKAFDENKYVQVGLDVGVYDFMIKNSLLKCVLVPLWVFGLKILEIRRALVA